MQDQDKTKEQLIDELNDMRRKVAELETTQATAMDTQETMRVNEERFRGMFEKHSAVMLLIEPVTGRIMDANKAAVLFYGYTVSHLCSMSIQDINALSLDDADAQRKLAIEQHRSHLMFPHRLANGEVRTVEVHSSPIEQNGAILLFSIIHDIAEWKQSAGKNLRLAAIVESSDDAIIGKTLDGTIKSWNKGAETLYGYSAEEVIGQPISLLVPPEQFDDLPDILTRISRGEVVRHFETKRRTKDGRIVDVSLTVSPIKTPEGKIIGASSTARDITERKLLEKERQKVFVELQKALSEVKQLSGFLPICASCKKIRDDKGYWNEVERYISEHSEAQFSHGICPDCIRKLYPEIADEMFGHSEKDEKK